MERTDIQKLRELPIEGVAERMGLRVSKHKSLCPFHEDRHPSLSYKNNGFRCFVCGAHGGVIDLAMHVLGKSFLETCQWLANEHNVILSEWKPQEAKKCEKTFDATRFTRFFERPYINPEASHFLFKERKLDPRVVSWCRLTSWRDRDGICWLQIPYFNISGKLTGVQWRRLTKSEVLPRFRFPKGSQCHVYNLPVLNLLKAKEPLFITEGASDCWAMLSSGHKAIAIPSATLLKPDDLKPLQACLLKLGTTFHIYPDNDDAGEALYKQLVSVANDIGVCLIRHQLPKGCKDYGDYYRTLSPLTLKL